MWSKRMTRSRMASEWSLSWCPVRFWHSSSIRSLALWRWNLPLPSVTLHCMGYMWRGSLWRLSLQAVKCKGCSQLLGSSAPSLLIRGKLKILELIQSDLNFPIIQVLWTFSIYLEAVAILPQLVLLQRTQNIDNLTGNYVFLLGCALLHSVTTTSFELSIQPVL